MILSLLLGRAPFALLWLVAGGLAIARYERHPLASLLVGVGAALSIFANIAGALLPALWRSHSESVTQLGMTSALISLVGAAGLGCVVAAVFVERK